MSQSNSAYMSRLVTKKVNSGLILLIVISSTVKVATFGTKTQFTSNFSFKGILLHSNIARERHY